MHLYYIIISDHINIPSGGKLRLNAILFSINFQLPMPIMER